MTEGRFTVVHPVHRHDELALVATLDTDDFRDRHERAVRDHILGGPPDHRCDDLCSDAIVDRLVGKKPINEYPWRVEL